LKAASRASVRKWRLHDSAQGKCAKRLPLAKITLALTLPAGSLKIVQGDCKTPQTKLPPHQQRRSLESTKGSSTLFWQPSVQANTSILSNVMALFLTKGGVADPVQLLGSQPLKHLLGLPRATGFGSSTTAEATAAKWDGNGKVVIITGGSAASARRGHASAALMTCTA
jgi:hypothetical protein